MEEARAAGAAEMIAREPDGAVRPSISPAEIGEIPGSTQSSCREIGGRLEGDRGRVSRVGMVSIAIVSRAILSE